MSLFDQRHRPSRSPSPSLSPSPSPLLQRIRGVSPTQRTSSQRRTHSQRLPSRTPNTAHSLRHSSSRKISRNNPPHVNHNIAKSQFAIMSSPSSRPQTPDYENFLGTDSSSPSTTLVNPVSSFLQDAIEERRASRNTKTPQPSEIVDNRPTTSGSHSKSLVASRSGKEKENERSDHKKPQDMGLLATKEYISKISKLNFDLQMRIALREQQLATLERKVERMHQIEQELERMQGLEDELHRLQAVEEHNQRLQEVNDQLKSEIDVRDQAVREAVDLIDELETKNEELRAELRAGRGKTSLPRNGSTDDVSEVCTPKAQTFVDIPDRTSSRKGTVRRPRKSPSFLLEKSGSTAALRSVFLAEENKSVRSVSASTIATTVDSKADPQSPRLSTLSECSDFFPQLTATGFDQLDRLDVLTLVNNDHSPVVAAPTENLSQGRLSDRISEWMQFDEHSPRRRNGNRPRALSDVSRVSQVPITPLDEPFQPMRKTRRTQRASPRQQHLADFGGNLPPTPDTMSTFRPTFKNGSNASLRMDRSLSRPRSAGELTTRSASMSTHSDGIDTAASVISQHNVQNNSIAQNSTFKYYGRGSAKTTRVRGPGSPIDPRISYHGGDLPFNEEVIENAVSDMDMTRALSLKATTPEASGESLYASALTPQDWLDAAKPEQEKSKMQYSSPELETDEMSLEDNNPIEFTTEEVNTPRNSPLRLHAWANESQPMPEVQQHRRRLSRFFTRNRQSKDTQPDSIPTPKTGPSPIPQKIVLVKHRRTSSGPGLNSDEGTAAIGRASGRALSKSLLDHRPSTASRPITSDSAEPRSKGSGLLGWMKSSASHNKDNEPSPSGHLRFARSTTERPQSTASLDVSNLGLGLDVAAPDDEPAWRARRRSRRMA